MNMEDLMISFKSAIEEGATYFCILVKLPNQEKPELIINQNPSFLMKSHYYISAYTKDLYLKVNPAVSILDWTYGDSVAHMLDYLKY